ncbi:MULTISPECIES: DNA cytosine methyltransferase [Prevotella]|uniref:Cytosine-specific methyltransferase n=1 Tax=Prevotella nigrescens TaxID=28133 RepID=A0A9D6A712_9BACT|nr:MULTISPECIES: DNA cytosine methyltransferase [Prevotella]MBF1446223.1 DNA cytosine methyltransferase [Prevotella nigrescens]
MVKSPKDKMVKKKYTFIDLFAGCGGLSEGFYRQGFKALSHVEMDHWACETLRTRMKFYGYKDYNREVIEHDITSDDILERIDNAVNGRTVDIIIGGPPCQAYSTAGRVRDGKKMASDPRNYLFESYVKILEYYSPKFFVFENVTGLLSAQVKNAPIFPKVLKALGNKYNVIGNPEVLVHNTADYGVPQLRKRVIIIGVRKDIDKSAEELYKSIIKTHWNPETLSNEKKGKKRFVDVRQAIGDLPSVEPGQDASTEDFDYPCNNEFLKRIGKPGIHPLMDHIARKHNDLDRERFQVMIHNHWSFGQLRREMPQYEHEHARVFDNSYVVQWWDLPSKTILAHIHKDGFQFIHPDEEQRRTFTVREAARIQSFPDDFEFKGSRGEKYKQIGNAVPPLFAEALAKSIKKNLIDITA